MPHKPIELPPEVARRFVEDMRAFFVEPNTIKRDEIAGRQMAALRKYQGPRDADATEKLNFVPGVNWFTFAHPHRAHSLARRTKLCPDFLNGSPSTC
jgi:hypothetical protein